ASNALRPDRPPEAVQGAQPTPGDVGTSALAATTDGRAAWERAHEAPAASRGRPAKVDFSEGCLILAAYPSHAWALLGYASLSEYIDHFLGHAPRQTRERLRVAEALERLPLVAHALESGELCWSVVREVSRVATAETEREWIELARGKRAS